MELQFNHIRPVVGGSLYTSGTTGIGQCRVGINGDRATADSLNSSLIGLRVQG
ncbi:hypothetical protein ACAW75_06215 [Fibrella sp. Tmos10]